MNKKVYKVFNEQVQAELYSAYMYLAMSLDMEAKNYIIVLLPICKAQRKHVVCINSIIPSML